MGIANHPVQPDENVNRVFVGIPDVFSTEQLARLRAVDMAVAIELKTFREDTESHLDGVLDEAERIAQYILNGSK